MKTWGQPKRLVMNVRRRATDREESDVDGRQERTKDNERRIGSDREEQTAMQMKRMVKAVMSVKRGVSAWR